MLNNQMLWMSIDKQTTIVAHKSQQSKIVVI